MPLFRREVIVPGLAVQPCAGADGAAGALIVSAGPGNVVIWPEDIARLIDVLEEAHAR